MLRHVFFTFAVLLCATAQNTKPDFSGTWELDAKASEFTKGRPISMIREVIDHKEPKLTIDRTIRYEQGESQQSWKLKTDNSEQWQSLPEGSIGARTRWDGDKLITELEDESGDHPMREERELDANGRMLVHMKYHTEDDEGEAKMVFVKKQ